MAEPIPPSIEMAPIRSVARVNIDDDERKGRKFEQMKQKQLANVLLLFGFFCLVFLAAIVKLKHLSRYAPRSLRKTRPVLERKVHPYASPFLPPNSIYRLSVEDGHGQPTLLDKYAGMVTLVVNVASHWGKTQLSYEQMSQLQERYGAKGFSVRSTFKILFIALLINDLND